MQKLVEKIRDVFVCKSSCLLRRKMILNPRRKVSRLIFLNDAEICLEKRMWESLKRKLSKAVSWRGLSAS